MPTVEGSRLRSSVSWLCDESRESIDKADCLISWAWFTCAIGAFAGLFGFSWFVMDSLFATTGPLPILALLLAISPVFIAAPIQILILEFFSKRKHVYSSLLAKSRSARLLRRKRRADSKAVDLDRLESLYGSTR